MKLGLKFPERLAGILYPVREALEDLITGIEKGWSQEHLGTGQHNAITAVSIGHPTPSETNTLAITSGLEVRQGPASLSRAFTYNNSDPAVLTPPQITANVNDYTPVGLDQALILRLNVDANRTITGLRRPQPTQARLYWLINTTSLVITLAHEAASSTATNRFYSPGATDYFLGRYGAVAVLYDPVQTRWRILDSSGAGVFYDASTYGFNTAAPATAADVRGQDPAINLQNTGSGTQAWRILNGFDAANDGKFVIRDQSAGVVALAFLKAVSGIVKAGFGTSSPSVNVDIQGQDPGIQLKNTGAGTQAWVIYNGFSVSNDGKFVIYDQSAGIAGLTLLKASGGVVNVGIGNVSPTASSLLDLASTTATLVIPRMTTTQKNNLTAINGMLVYDTTLAKFQGYEGGAWTNLI